MTTSSLQRLLKDARAKKRLSQKQVARKLHISQSLYSRMERLGIPENLIEKLAEILGVEEELLVRINRDRIERAAGEGLSFTVSSDELHWLAPIAAAAGGRLSLAAIVALVKTEREKES